MKLELSLSHFTKINSKQMGQNIETTTGKQEKHHRIEA
jgi:hypothetical protein